MFFVSILKSSVSVRDFFVVLMIARVWVEPMVRWIVLSYPSKNVCGGAEASALSGGYGGGASVAGGQDSGGDGGNAWRIVGSTNGGATNVLFFCCVGICSDDGGGNGRGTMQKID